MIEFVESRHDARSVIHIGELRLAHEARGCLSTSRKCQGLSSLRQSWNVASWGELPNDGDIALTLALLWLGGRSGVIRLGG